MTRIKKSAKREPTPAQLLGALGGRATAAKYSKQHYTAAGSKGAKATLQKYGTEHYRQMGLASAAKKKAAAKKRKT